MSGYCLHAAQTGTAISLHAHSRRQSFTQKHQQIHTGTALSRRTCKHGSKHGRLTILAASSTDEAVRRSNDPIRSAQDLADGVQDFLDEAQRSLSTDEAPLPEHPIGEVGTIDVAEGIDAAVSLWLFWLTAACHSISGLRSSTIFATACMTHMWCCSGHQSA